MILPPIRRYWSNGKAGLNGFPCKFSHFTHGTIRIAPKFSYMLTIRCFIRLFVITLEGREKFYSKYYTKQLFLLILPFSGHIGLNRIVKGKRWLKEGIMPLLWLSIFLLYIVCMRGLLFYLKKIHNRKG